MNFTKKEILEILKADYRQRIQYDETVMAGLEINENTLIEEWRDVCDLLSWKPLSQYLNEWFGVNIAWNEWKKTVFPECKKTLGDLVELLAKYAVKPVLDPIKLFDKMCLKAGVFKTLLRRLEKRGADITNIRPSTPVTEWLKSNVGYLMQEVNLMAPKALPILEIKFHKGYDYGFNLLIVGFFLFLLIGWFFQNYFLIIIGGLLTLLGYVMMYFFAKKDPIHVDFEGITDFRDLVETIIKNR